MIVAHLSDLHLGFRAHGRVDRGSNLRERDVARAFERAVGELVRIAPSVVVVSGDVFDRPNPPPSAVVVLARGLELLRSSLPDTPVLMVAGPRDTPRRPGDPGALAVLDTFPNVEAATGLMRTVFVERLELNACLVSYRATTRDPPAVPEADPRVRWNLLVMHARSEGRGQTGVHVEPAEWSYVALGGEHRRRALEAHVGYAGSLERTELDPWEEAGDEKGFVLADLERGDVSFHRIPGRAVVALAPISVGRGDPDRLRRRVREVTDEVPGGIDDKIVRLTLQGARPTDLLALQGEQLHDLRRRALHLTVEAGRAARVPADAWLPVHAPALLGDAVAEELERDGLLDPDMSALVDRVVRTETADGEGPVDRVGAVEAMDGEVRGLGRVSTSVPRGLTAIIGGEGRARRAILELLVDAGRGASEGALQRFWEGGGRETLTGTLTLAVQAVAESRGLAVVDAALRRAGARSGQEGAYARPTEAGPGAVRVDPEQVAAEMRAADRELRSVRADSVEADGDLEAATMDWHRERQDAETTLHAYRDRARELRARVRQIETAGPDAECPTCGRPLETHYDEVVAELRDAFEAVVQDGSWWRRRWEQLEPKPDHLRELERRSLRLHAALEAGSERVELLRARLADLGDVRVVRETAAPISPADEALVAALRRVRRARVRRAREVLLERASRYVCRISGGRILAMSWQAGTAHLEGDLSRLGPLSEEDLAAGRVAIRLATASLVSAEGRVLASLVLEAPFDRLDEEAQIRTVVLARALLADIPRVVLFTAGEAVDARPEAFDTVLEVNEDAAGLGPALRPAAAGMGTVLFSPARSGTATFRI